MASIEESDLVEGSTITDSASGSITRVFIVKDVTGTATSRPISVLSVVGIPARGDAHPDNANLKADSITAIPVNGTGSQYKVTVVYIFPSASTPGGATEIDTGSTTQFTASTVSVQTTQDAADVLMVVGTIDFDGTETDTAKFKMPVMVNKQITQFTMVSSRTETSNPALVLKNKTGKLNSDAVSIAGIAFLAKSLFMQNITATTNDGGDTYAVSYTIVWRTADDWKINAILINPKTGNPWPNHINIIDSTKSFELYETATFSDINL